MWAIEVFLLICGLSVGFCDSYNYPPIPSASNLNYAGPLRIVSRMEWLAMPPMRQLTPLQLPSKRVIIAHTGDQTCSTLVSCTEHVQAIQRYHIESRRFDDIAYNFLVGGDGFVYVGRGWDFQGAHTKGFNANSICIAFIGTFDNYAPTEPQLDAAKKLIEEGVQLKKLPEDYALYGHRQLTPTQSPGTVLFNIIKTWEHWTEVVSRR